MGTDASVQRAILNIIIIISVLTRMSAQMELVGVQLVKTRLGAIVANVQRATSLTVFSSFVSRLKINAIESQLFV